MPTAVEYSSQHTAVVASWNKGKSNKRRTGARLEKSNGVTRVIAEGDEVPPAPTDANKENEGTLSAAIGDVQSQIFRLGDRIMKKLNENQAAIEKRLETMESRMEQEHKILEKGLK